MMKKIITLALALTLTNIAHSADWTPVFKHLQHQHAGDEGKVLNSIIDNIFVNEVHNQDERNIKINPLTKYAQKGNYPNVAQKYRADILPAKAYKNPDNEVVLRAVIPLKNATLYGLPLQSLTYEYYCFGCDGVGFYATFAPMSNTQYHSLKKRIRFVRQEIGCGEEGYAAEFHKDSKAVHLVLNIGC